jgi:hypothetical protein
MRRVLALPVLVIAMLAAAGVAVADDVNGPKCADITSSSWLYSGDGTTASVDLILAAASCPSISYTLFAQDSAADETAVGTPKSARGDGSALPDGTGFVSLTMDIPEGDRDGEVCLYATTSVGPHVFDRAPDADLSPNCVELTPGGTGGGGGGFN